MKKILALVMALSLVACGSKDNNDTPDDGKKANTIKVGLICIGDENDQGYTYNFIRGKEAATEALAAKGINVEWVIKYNKGENDDCTNANIECAEEGCQLIINNSYGHEPFMLKVAEVEKALKDGTLQVFDTSKFTVKGETVTHAFALDTDGDFTPDAEEAVFDGAFHESYFQSAPYFTLQIDGIEWLNSAYGN